jgi:hypothetical protein
VTQDAIKQLTNIIKTFLTNYGHALTVFSNVYLPSRPLNYLLPCVLALELRPRAFADINELKKCINPLSISKNAI